MALNPGISNAAAIAACNAIVDLLDEGTGGAGYINIYDGSQPADVDTAVSGQTLLATLPLSATAFGNAVDGTGKATATAAAITSDADADASGTATWFRAFDSSDVAIIDGSAGTSTTDLILDNATIVAGGTVAISTWTFSISES